MVDPDRRPTAQEIEELIDLVRRDPSSPAFIDLGEAYLALGRPKDAITVGIQGIEQAPDNLEGRVMLARAYASLHQWKEAQGELLRVVKVDRSNRVGFALLGEVLLRRNDYERAVPVLQHAQNLDPTSPAILSMLKRARNGQPLDPPAPVPTPVPPRGETDYNLPIERSQRARPQPAQQPPQVAFKAPSAPPRTSRAQPSVVPQASPAAPTMAFQPDPGAEAWGPTVPAPPPQMPSAPPQPPPPARAPKQTAPPPPQQPVDGIRPRVIATKEQNAAAASLRQSAAVGENYLNDLLTGGLLDVAGVRVPESDFDLRPDRRWGRSTRRAFVFLFVVLVLGIGGGGTWYWWTNKQAREAVERLQKEAKLAIGAAEFDGLEKAMGLLADAQKKDDSDLLTKAFAAQTSALEALLYGTDVSGLDDAVTKLAHYIPDPDPKKPGEWTEEPGWREIVIARVALNLSRLGTLDEAQAKAVVGNVHRDLDQLLAKHADDKWAGWLRGRVQLAAGDRKSAMATFKAAADGDTGVALLAKIDEASMLVDEGKLDDALALYEAVLAKAKDHPLALLGRALARAESGVNVNDAIDDLSVKVQKTGGARIAAFDGLGLALAYASVEDYTKSGELIKRASSGRADYKPPWEPGFWARVAWVNLTRGELDPADKHIHQCKWFSVKPDPDPQSLLVYAGLWLAKGQADRALDLASKLGGLRAALVRAYADLDLGKAKDALAEVDDILKKSPDNLEAQIARERARMLLASEKDRTAIADGLEKLARKAKTKIGRHALGVAYLALGDTKNAQPQLEQALDGISDEAPNPIAYRTHTALARILLDAGNLQDANKHVDDAVKANPTFYPAFELRAMIFVRNGQPDVALDLIAELDKRLKADDDAKGSPLLELARAEALCTKKGAAPADKDRAEKILTDIKDKVQPASDLGRAAAACDPKLPEKLGVPAPTEGGGTKQPPRPSRRHR